MQHVIKDTDNFNTALAGVDTKKNVDYISTFLRDCLPFVAQGTHTGCGTACAYNTDLGPTMFKSTCHKQFSSEACSQTTFVATLFTNNTWPEANREYLEYILSEKESPWKNIFDDMVVIRDAKDGYPYGFVFFSVNEKDIKLLTSFLIVSRMSGSWKQSPMFRYFNKISGFTKPESIFLSSYFSLSTGNYRTTEEAYGHVYEGSLQKPSTYINLQGQCSGDQPFNYRVDIDKLAKSRPESSNKIITLKQGARPNPCNFMWDREGNWLSASVDDWRSPAKVSGKRVIEYMRSDKPLPKDIMDVMKQGLYGEKMVYFGDYNG